MRIVIALCFSLVLAVIARRYYNKSKDVFSPIVISCLIAIIRYTPGIAFYEEHMGITISENNSFVVAVFELLFILCLCLGYIFYGSYSRKKQYLVIKSKKVTLTVCGYTLYIIGFIAGVYFLTINGGITFMINNIIGQKYANGNSYILALMNLMVFGLALVLYDNREKKHPVSLLIIFGFIWFSIFYLIQTKRSPILEALMVLVMVYHYCVKRMSVKRIFQPKYVLLILLCVSFIVLMPQLRTSDGFKTFGSLNSTIDAMNDSLGNIFKELSYTARDSFIYENYNLNNYWLGKNIVNLILAPIPSTLLQSKPPVDDGMYIANAVKGYFIQPPSANLPWYNSYPLSSPGGLYVNFGVFGLIVGGFILGILYHKIYRILIYTEYNVVVVMIYQLVIYQLEFSSLSIVQTITPLLLLLVSTRLICGFRIKRTGGRSVNG